MIAVAAIALGLGAAPAFAQTRLNTGASGTYGQVRLNSGFTPDPHSVTVQAGGTLDASAVAHAACVGNIAARPDFSLRYRAGELPLIISALSDGDTTLVVRAPNGTYSCDDDGAGNLNPVVRFSAPQSGRYQIWVGTFSAESAPAQLNISEVFVPQVEDAPQGIVSGAGPNPGLEPAYGSLALTAGFLPDPRTVEISAGGNYAASNLGAPGCTGFIAAAPDFRLNYTAGSLPLIFSVAAGADTTLVVNTPDGRWHCDDDGGVNGLNPALRFDGPMSGQYDIWVGTYAEGALQQSTLYVSEVSSQ